MMPRRSAGTGIAIAVITACLAATLVSCSDSHTAERGYALPATLCELKVPHDSISMIFKSGKEISKEDDAQWGTKSGQESQGCRYDIDGLPSVDMKGEWVSRENPQFTPDSRKALKQYYDPSGNPRDSKGRYDTATWLHGFVVTFKCTSTDKDYRYDWFQVRLSVDQLLFKDSESRTHREYGKLAADVAPAVKKKLSCGVE